MNAANHPIWAFARLTVVLIALTVILAMTAQRFDNTELQTILWMFLAVAGVEGAGQVIGRIRGQGGQNAP